LNKLTRFELTSPQKTYQFAVLETGIAIASWGLSFVLIKMALREVSPVTLIILRFLIGSLILSMFALIRGDFSNLQRSDLSRMALLGVVGVSLQQILQVSGQVTAKAGTAAFLASTAPAFIVLFGGLFLRERLRVWQVLGVLLASLGAGVVSSGGKIDLLLSNPAEISGSLLVLLSSIVWAAFSILSRYIVRGRPPILMTAGMMVSGCIFLMPVFIYQAGWLELSQLSAPTWASVGLLGLLCTAAAYLLYNHALKLAPASRLAAIQAIEPLIAVIAASVVLSEVLTPALAAGGAAILLGVFLAERFAPGLGKPSESSQIIL
jgi:drug/metabolite transporter (DMT)-like permease